MGLCASVPARDVSSDKTSHQLATAVSANTDAANTDADATASNSAKQPSTQSNTSATSAPQISEKAATIGLTSGTRLRVFWKEQDSWFAGSVVTFDTQTGLHTLRLDADPSDTHPFNLALFKHELLSAAAETMETAVETSQDTHEITEDDDHDDTNREGDESSAKCDRENPKGDDKVKDLMGNAKFGEAVAEARAAAADAAKASTAAAAAAAEEMLRKKNAREEESRRRALRRKHRIMREATETACVAREAFNTMKLSLQSHTTTGIVLATDTPLVVTFGAPPTVDSTARLRKRQEEGTPVFVECPRASVTVDQRPMANKVRLVCQFPSESGEYELAVFCQPHVEDKPEDDISCGTLVLRYEIFVADDGDDEDASESGDTSTPNTIGTSRSPSPQTKKRRTRPSKIGTKILARTGSFGSSERTTLISSSELWKGPAVSPRGGNSTSTAKDAIAPRILPTHIEEENSTATKEEEEEEEDTTASRGQIGRKMKRLSMQARESVAAKRRLQTALYEGRVPVTSAHFQKCRLALQSHPELLIKYGHDEARRGGRADEKKDDKRVNVGAAAAKNEDEDIARNKPSSANGPLLVTLRMPPNVDAVAVLKKWTVDAKRLVDVKYAQNSNGRRRGAMVDARPKSHKLRLLVWFPAPGMYELDVHCRDGAKMKGSKNGDAAKLVLTYVVDAKKATSQSSSSSTTTTTTTTTTITTPGKNMRATRSSPFLQGTKERQGALSPRGSSRRKKALAGKKMKRSDSFTFRPW